MGDVGELILQNLNPAQREAVTAPDGPLLVFAGAGSGKTRVLTRRIAYLIAVRDVHPSEILAVTFTNKAADVMRGRVEELLGRHAMGMWIHTFHGACVRILRSHAERVGRKPGFSIYDEADQQTLLKELFGVCEIDTDVFAVRQAAYLFDQAKNEAADPATLASHAPPSLREKYVHLCQLYATRVREANAFDFGDLIVETLRLLRENPEVRDGYRGRFRHLLVDEFQDTNRAQDLLIDELLGAHRNLMVVGDDDQSIYRWRGARIQNILDFEKKFPEAKVIVLGTNYRSTSRILQAADAVIKQNRGRKPKTLDTPNPEGAAIQRFVADDEYDEARFVARTAQELVTRRGLRPGDIAVFYRTNAQSRMIEEKLLETGLPYVVIGGTRFYDRKEVKDALGYLRLLINPNDGVALGRVINVPARNIGPRTVERIAAFAQEKACDVVAACRRVGAGEGELPTGARGRVAAFAQLIDRATTFAQEHKPSVTAGYVLREAGYIAALEASKKVEDKTRLENLAELLKAIEDFEDENEDEATLSLFLERVSLLSDPDLYDERANAISLMTLHAAKGLEFPAVIMIGLEDGLLPHSRSKESPAEFEEERRLCYVGITRTKERLFLTAAAMRRSFGGVPMPTRLSPFWFDLPPQLVEDIGSTRPNVSAFTTTRSTAFSSGPTTRLIRPREETIDPLFDYDESQDPADQPKLELLCRVRHPHFGPGVVTHLAGSGQLARATVRFDKFGEKTLILKYANLQYVAPPSEHL
jgi:DNA helicase-2/ATP-dependent DNA helicase PcrA